jgi:DKNYY family
MEVTYEKIGELYRAHNTLYTRMADGEEEPYYCPLKATRYNNLQTVDVPSLVCIAAHEYQTPFGDKAYSKRLVSYYTDKNSVYFDKESTGDLCILPGATPETFSVLSADEIKIKNYHTSFFSESSGVFFYKSSAMLFDPRRVVDLGNNYYQLGTRLFYGFYTEMSPGFDIATFKTIAPERDTATALDVDNVYFKGVVQPGIEPASFAFLSECVALERQRYVDCDISFYAADRNYAYYVCPPFQKMIKKLPQANVSKFIFYVDPLRKNYGFATDGVYEYNAGVRKKLGSESL